MTENVQLHSENQKLKKEVDLTYLWLLQVLSAIVIFIKVKVQVFLNKLQRLEWFMNTNHFNLRTVQHL